VYEGVVRIRSILPFKSSPQSAVRGPQSGVGKGLLTSDV